MTNHDKIHIDVTLVKNLIATQFPQWVNLLIKPVEHGGWDNRTFHLGDHMIVRLPSAAAYSLQVEKEQKWLPKLAASLPLSIPIPLAIGKPDKDYPWPWSIYQWIDGETASIDRIADLRQFAIDLAKFLVALQKNNATNGPLAGSHNFYRGGPLSTYDAETRQMLATIENKSDAKAMTIIWEEALSSTWQSAPVWVHGDIAVGNLLVAKGQLSAVIDFGCMGIGDPACDLAIAWTLFKSENRDAFRKALSTDKATWARARGWALWKALLKCSEQRRVIDEILADYKHEQGAFL